MSKRRLVDYIYYLGGTLPDPSPNGDISKEQLVKRALEIAAQRSGNDEELSTYTVKAGAKKATPQQRPKVIPIQPLLKLHEYPYANSYKKSAAREFAIYDGFSFAFEKIQEFENQPNGRRVRIPALFILYDNFDLNQVVSCIPSSTADTTRGVSYYEPDDFSEVMRMEGDIDSKLLPLQCAIKDTDNKSVKIYPTTYDLEDWKMIDGRAKKGTFVSFWRKGCGRVNLEKEDDVCGGYLVNYVFLKDIKAATNYQEYLNMYLMWARDYEAFYVNFIEQFPRLSKDFLNPPLLPVMALGWCNIENYESQWSEWLDQYMEAVPGKPKISTSDYVLTVATQPKSSKYYTLKHFLSSKLRSLCPTKAEGLMMKNEILAVLHLVLLDLIYRLSLVYDRRNSHTQFLPKIELDDILVLLDDDNYHIQLFLLPRDYKNLFSKYAPIRDRDVKYSTSIRKSSEFIDWSIETIKHIAVPINSIIDKVY